MSEVVTTMSEPELEPVQSYISSLYFHLLLGMAEVSLLEELYLVASLGVYYILQLAYRCLLSEILSDREQ